MKIVVTAQAEGLEAKTSPLFGRCPVFVVVDSEMGLISSIPNPALNAHGGAGTQAGQLMVTEGVDVILTGNLGPNAGMVLQAAGLPVYRHKNGSVQETLEAYQRDELEQITKPMQHGHHGNIPT